MTHMTHGMSQEVFEEKYPEAFGALPEPYQADSCLYFIKDERGLFAQPLESQVKYLGIWKSIYNGVEWIDYSINGVLV